MSEALPEAKSKSSGGVRLRFLIKAPNNAEAHLFQRKRMYDVFTLLRWLQMGGAIHFDNDPVIEKHKIRDML
jgi:hypothetical protein